MTRDGVLEAVARLAARLPAGSHEERVARLTERVSATEDAEALRDALTELGALALLRKSL